MVNFVVRRAGWSARRRPETVSTSWAQIHNQLDLHRREDGGREGPFLAI